MYKRQLLDYYISRLDSFEECAKKLYGCNGIFIPAGTTPNMPLPCQLVPVIINWTGAADVYKRQVYDSKKITIAQAGLAASVSLINPAEKLPIPNNGTVSTEFFAQCYDKAGSEAYGIPLKWSLLNADETELNDSGISIDENTGVISSTSSAAASSFKVKVALKDNPVSYTHLGWTTDDGVQFADSKSAETTFTMPSKAVTVTANWTKSSGGNGGGNVHYTVSFETNGGNDIASKTVTKNSVIKEPESPIKAGFDFEGCLLYTSTD